MKTAIIKKNLMFPNLYVGSKVEIITKIPAYGSVNTVEGSKVVDTNKPSYPLYLVNGIGFNCSRLATRNGNVIDRKCLIEYNGFVGEDVMSDEELEFED